MGIFCVVGASQRLTAIENKLFFLALFYNRVIIGFVIGLSDKIVLVKGKKNPIFRGILLGGVVGLGFFLSTGMKDPSGLYAALVYGLLIDFTVTSLVKEKN